MQANAGPHDVPIETDALVIGAGPVGLFQVFQLGLLEMRAEVVDSLPQAGGQCIELYPDKPIYDIPAVPVCTGRELIDRLLKQIEPFTPGFHLGQQVTGLHKRKDGRFDVETSRHKRFVAKAVFIAGGAGSFQPRLLKVDGLDKFEGTQLFYRVDDAAQFAGKRVVIVGGGDAAVDWALHFVQRAASVTLVHRRDVFTAAPASTTKLNKHREAGEITFIAGQITGIEEANGRLNAVQITSNDAVTHALSLDALLVFFGLSPKLGPVADWGFALERKQIVVDTEKFETNVPGLFAVGDMNIYPGKKKLILCGFHEATLAAFGAAAIVFPARPVQLQYTTTSTRLHKVLGVETPRFEA